MKRKAQFRVELVLPETATANDAKEYINSAVSAWHGSLFPGSEEDPPDPMWGLDPASVKVTILKEPRTKPGKDQDL